VLLELLASLIALEHASMVFSKEIIF